MSSNIISGYKFSRNSQLPPPTHVNGLPKGWHVIALGDFNLEDSEVCHITCLAIMESSQMDHLKWPLGPWDYWGQDRSRFQDFQDHFTPWKKLVLSIPKKFETWFPNFKVIAFWTHLQEDVLILPVFFPTSLCKYSICVGANVPEKAQQMGTAPWKSLAPWKSSNDGNWKRNFISTVTSSEFFGTSSGYIYVDIQCISTVQTMQQARMACWNRW